MPITYEIEIVDCLIEIYGEFNDYEDEYTVLIQPETRIDLFANSVCRVLRDTISTELREADANLYYMVERDNDPPQVQVQGELPDSISLVTIGELIGDGIHRAEDELTNGNKVDNADLNAGLAKTLEVFEREDY